MKPSPIAERIERRAGNPRQQSAANTDPPIPLPKFAEQVLGGTPDQSSYPSMIVCERFGRDAVAICVGIEFGAISSVTRLANHAAMSTI
jgi:hypothetical protein